MQLTLLHSYLWTIRVAEGEEAPAVGRGVQFEVTAGPLAGLRGHVVAPDYDIKGQQAAKVELPTEEVLDRMRRHLLLELDLLPSSSEREFVLEEALRRLQRAS